VSRRRTPAPGGFPRFGKAAFDAGKCDAAPPDPRRRPGASTVHDIDQKTIRSGTMIYLMHRMEFTNQRSELASVVDWRMVVRP
jgi:hypothetical protein